MMNGRINHVAGANTVQERIYIACPGGLEGTWGMSLIMRYFSEAWDKSAQSPPLRIVDTTGSHVGWQSVKVWRQPLTYALAIYTIVAAVLSRRICLLYLQTAEGGSVLRKLFLAALVLPFGVPVVLHMHAAAFPAFFARMPRICQRVITYMFNRCEHIVVLGASFARYFETIVEVEQRRIVIIPNGVPDPGATPPDVGHSCNLLFLGTLTERKGLSDLFEALARPEILARDWHLAIAGAGDAAPWHARLLALGLADRVSLHGWAGPNAVRRLLTECDVLALPSHDEGLPLVILEAMAHGRPVIATPVGSVLDAVAHEVTGLVVEPGHVDALATAIGWMTDNPERRVQMGRNARDRYEAKYTIEQMNEKLAALFTSVLKSGRVTGSVPQIETSFQLDPLPAFQVARQVSSVSPRHTDD